MTLTTRTTRKAPWAVVMTALLAVLGMVFGVMAAVPSAADPDPTQVCAPLDSGKIDLGGEHTTWTITAPAGQLITGYCVKAGSTQQGDGPVYTTLTTPVASVEISHPSGKAISNYSFSLGEVPTYYYAGTGLASDTACTLVAEDTWEFVDFGPFSVTGETVGKGTEWSDADKAVEDAKAQEVADQQLADAMATYTIDETGVNCTPPPPPPVPGSATFCVAPVGTTTYAYDTFGTTDDTTPQGTWTNGSGQPLSAYVIGTTADCTPTPPPPPPPPPTEPEPTVVVEAATVEEPEVVAPVLPATVEEPTEVAIPAAATLPATIPAGDPAPTVPTYALALLLLGTTALAASTARLVRTTR